MAQRNKAVTMMTAPLLTDHQVQIHIRPPVTIHQWLRDRHVSLSCLQASPAQPYLTSEQCHRQRTTCPECQSKHITLNPLHSPPPLLWFKSWRHENPYFMKVQFTATLSYVPDTAASLFLGWGWEAGQSRESRVQLTWLRSPASQSKWALSQTMNATHSC